MLLSRKYLHILMIIRIMLKSLLRLTIKQINNKFKNFTKTSLSHDDADKYKPKCNCVKFILVNKHFFYSEIN